MKVLLLSLLLLVSVQMGLAQGADDYVRLVEDLMPSIVSVETFDAAGDGLNRGSGFCVGPGLFITNFHVVEGAVRIVIRTTDKKIHAVSLESGNKSADIALLRLQTASTVKPLKFAPSLSKVGEKIIVVGNPLGLTGTVSDGIISAIRGNNQELIQITAPISQGSSGSPVVNLRGQVVGVATMNVEGGQNLNFAVSSSYIKKLWPDKFEIARISENTTAPNDPIPSRWRRLNLTSTTYDSQTLTKLGDIVTVWMKYPESNGSYENVLYEFTCSTRRIRQLQSVSYNNKGVVTRSSNLTGESTAVIPETDGEYNWGFFCDGVPDRQTEIELFNYRKTAQQLVKDNKLPDAIETYWKHLQLGSDLCDDKKLGTTMVCVEMIIGSSDLEDIYKKQNDANGLEKLYKFEISKGKTYRYRSLATLYQQHAMSLRLRQLASDAVKVFEKRTGLKESGAGDFGILADMYLVLDQRQNAVTTLVAGLQKFPTSGFLALDLSRIYKNQRLWKKCVDLIEPTLRTLADDSYREQLLSILKESYEKLGDKTNAARVEGLIRALK